MLQETESWLSKVKSNVKFCALIWCSDPLKTRLILSSRKRRHRKNVKSHTLFFKFNYVWMLFLDESFVTLRWDYIWIFLVIWYLNQKMALMAQSGSILNIQSKRTFILFTPIILSATISLITARDACVPVCSCNGSKLLSVQCTCLSASWYTCCSPSSVQLPTNQHILQQNSVLGRSDLNYLQISSGYDKLFSVKKLFKKEAICVK